MKTYRFVRMACADGSDAMIPDPSGDWVPREVANSELSALRARVAELEANEARYIEQLQEQNNRLATLEAPPVVPEGYEVTNGFCARWNLWSPTADRPVVLDSPAALRALAWAIEHDQRPPHASDGKEGGEHG